MIHMRLARAGTARWWWRPASSWLACLATVMLLMACTSGDDDEKSSVSTSSKPTTTTEPAATTTTYATVEDEISSRYRAFWDARFAASSPPDPDDSALREYATGEQLDHVVAEIRSHRDNGVAFRHAETPANFRKIEVVNVSDTTAVIQECVVSDDVVYRPESGEIVDDRVATYNLRGEMTKVDGVWRLSKATAVQRWDGVAGCALAP